MSGQVQPIPYPDFRTRLLKLYLPPLRAKATLGAMRRVLDQVDRLPAPDRTDGLTSDLVADFVQSRSRTVCTNTVIGELGYLAAACSFAFDEGWLARNPFRSRRLRLRAEPPEGRRYHSIEDVSRVLRLLERRSGPWKGGRLHAAASLVAHTGLRRNEALRLRCEDLDLTAGLVFVVSTRANRLKTAASAAPVPIAPALAEVLRHWAPRCGSEWLFPAGHGRGPWTGGNAGYKPLDKLKEAALDVGVPGMTWLSLRHTWATQAESAWGLPEGAIRRVLRHTSDLTQRRYRHADGVNLVQLARSITFEPSPH